MASLPVRQRPSDANAEKTKSKWIPAVAGMTKGGGGMTMGGGGMTMGGFRLIDHRRLPLR
ncbi:hypothetical protein PRJ39_10205 [Lysobacter enzymogenes]|uniref:hypothetical protein n=1 Tax=Lysobacter enzymogenes TaxID=69 RepID=UPI003749978E